MILKRCHYDFWALAKAPGWKARIEAKHLPRGNIDACVNAHAGIDAADRKLVNASNAVNLLRMVRKNLQHYGQDKEYKTLTEYLAYSIVHYGPSSQEPRYWYYTRWLRKLTGGIRFEEIEKEGARRRYKVKGPEAL